MSDQQPTPTIGERLVRLEGKIDAYAAGQSARIDEHERRLSGHDAAIGDLRVVASSHVTREELGERMATAPVSSGMPRLSPIAVIGLIIAAAALLAPALSSLITLIEKIAN